MGRRGQGGRGNRGGNRRNNGNRMQARATSDVTTAFAPQLAELQRLLADREAQAGNYQRAVASLYGGLGPQLAQVGQQFAPQMAGISGDYSDAIAKLASLLGTSTPAGEQAAAAGLLGNIGGGGLELLASQAARNAGYQASAQRQAPIDATNYQANILQQLSDYQNQVGQQRSDIASQMPGQILSQLAQLRDQARQFQLAQKEYQLRAAAAHAQMGSDRGVLDFVRRQGNTALNLPRPGGEGAPPTSTTPTTPRPNRRPRPYRFKRLP